MPANDDSPYQKAPGEKASLEEFARIIERVVRLGIHTVMPGVVVSLTPGTVAPPSPATVRVQPSRMVVYYDHKGEETPKPMPPIPAAILGFYSGTHRQTAPIVPGQHGWLLCSERSIEAWRASSGAPEAPPFRHTHNPTDALFLPVGPPGGAALVHDPAAYVIATNTGAPLEPGELAMDLVGNLLLEGPTIRLGRAAAAGGPVIRGTPYAAAWAAFASTVATAFATWGATQPPTAITNGAFIGALGPAIAALAGSVAGQLSTKVTVE